MRLGATLLTVFAGSWMNSCKFLPSSERKGSAVKAEVATSQKCHAVPGLESAFSGLKGSKLLERSAFLADSCTEPIPIQLAEPVSSKSDAARRLRAIANVRIADLLAPPGETYLLQDKEGAKAPGGILLNIVVDDDASAARSVDVWNGMESLVAALQAGRTTLGQVDAADLLILVRGYKTPEKGGDKINHWVQAAGFDFELKEDGKNVWRKPIVRDNEPLAIEVAPHLTNFQLGSRTSLGKLRSQFGRPAGSNDGPMVAIQLGTFDPPHKGHYEPIDAALSAQISFPSDSAAIRKIEEIVTVAMPAPHKPNASSLVDRIEMARLSFLSRSDSLVYLAASSAHWQEFDNQVLDGLFFDILRSAYGTFRIHQITGQDVWDTYYSKNSDRILKSRFPYLLVTKRGGEPMVPVSPTLKEKVFVLPDVERAEGLSSTKLRKSLSQGLPVGDALEAETVKYIKQKKLYGAPSDDSSANKTAVDPHGD